MPKMIFVNLPVTNVARSTEFYKSLGATQNLTFSDESGSCMVFSDTIYAMLLDHNKFGQFTPKKIADARATSEVLLCLSADTKAEVDNFVEKAAAAGGNADPAPKQDFGFMYGRSFEDPDGHLWEIVWMDMAEATKSMGEPAE